MVDGLPRRLRRLFVCFGLLLILGASPASGQSERSRSVDLPAQRLSSALTTVGQWFGITIVAAGELTLGQSAPAIAGEMTAKEAVQRLLSGSGLRVVENGRDVLIVEEAPENRRTGMEAGVPVAIQSNTVTNVVEEILVTGTKRDQSIQETQISVELYDDGRIEREALFELDDLAVFAPNVSTQGQTRDLSVRGVSRRGVGLAGSGNTLNVYVDSAPVSELGLGGLETLWDIEQVEVLRGPQSTIQGRNALAGAIIVNTKDPTYDLAGDVRMIVANPRSQQYSAALSGAIVPNQLAARLAVDYQDTEGDLENATTGEQEQRQEALNIVGKLLIEPEAIAELRVELFAVYQDAEQGAFNRVTTAAPANSPDFSDFDPFGGVSFGQTLETQTETYRVGGNASYRVSDVWELFSLITYEDTDAFRAVGDVADLSVFGGAGQNMDDSETVSAEVRANFEFPRFSGWIGAYYFDESEDNRFLFDVLTPGGPFRAFESGSSNAVENYAVFGELLWAVGPRWSFVFGARYDREEQTSSDLVGSLPTTDTRFDAFLPKAGVIYGFTDSQSLSFTYSRGYRAGGVRLLNVIGAGQVLNTFDPEFLDNFELAYRSTWLEERLVFNINAFFGDWTDQQVAVLVGDIASLAAAEIRNAGSSEMYGFEVSGSYATPIEGLQLDASFGYLETEFTDFPFAAGSGTLFGNLKGNEFPTAPNFTASFGLSYSHSSGVYTNWTISHQSEQFSDVENLEIDEADAYTIVNARLGYRVNQFEVFVYASNLFDDRAVTQSDLSAVDTTAASPTFGQPTFRPQRPVFINEPRTVGGGVRWRF